MKNMNHDPGTCTDTDPITVSLEKLDCRRYVPEDDENKSTTNFQAALFLLLNNKSQIDETGSKP